MTDNRSTIKEIESVSAQLQVDANDQNYHSSLRRFELECRGVRVELCSLGASVTKWLVPSFSDDNDDNDDIVLGYKSPDEMLASGNPSYLSVVVGRVANRIAQGKLQLKTNDGIMKTFPLAINNETNHLHGGEQGLSRKIWNAEIIRQCENNNHDVVYDAIQFSYTSASGDQGYPGTVQFFAVYSLRPDPHKAGRDNNSVSLRLELSAVLADGDDNCTSTTPVNLAQHSYFNLSRHDDPNGVLDHTLTMPSGYYTPLDVTSIPTREVTSLNDDAVMDWRKGKLVREAIQDMAISKLNMDAQVANQVLSNRSTTLSDFGLNPFGFDHNYVVDQSAPDADGLHWVATLQHHASKRTLKVRTTAPGVQLYTANYLNGSEPPPSHCKDQASYWRWQGLCLETQHFPDSIHVDEKVHPDFAKGKCVLLSRDNRVYRHIVVYDLEWENQQQQNDNSTKQTIVFRGLDSDGNEYDSADVMWQIQGVSDTNTLEWYDRASQYYEDNCPETIDGVLGGFANITDLDLEGSREFVKNLERHLPSGWTWSKGAAAECGAGIGRVSKGLLLGLDVTRCDLVESSARLLSAAPDFIGPQGSLRCRFYCQGLQHWMPAKNLYSIIWIQWVFCYLTDKDAVSFLQRCGQALVPGGVICLKENTCNHTDFVLDRDDASVTRSVPYLLHLAKQAGLKVVLQQFQTNFPDEIFPVPMIALAPVQA